MNVVEAGGAPCRATHTGWIWRWCCAASRDGRRGGRDPAARSPQAAAAPAANEVFQRSFTALAVRFDAHMEFEEEHLVPLLTKGHAHGPVRRQRVHADHARQRRLLQE